MKIKTVAIILLAMAISACNLANKPKTKIDANNLRLTAFLDSIGTLDPLPMIEHASYLPDSVYKSQVVCQQVLEKADYENLIAQASKGAIDKRLFARLFTDKYLDSTLKSQNKIPVNITQFAENQFEKFALAIAINSWESFVLFFDQNTLVGIHNIFHKYGLVIESFINEQNRLTLYYRQNFESGTGIWWWNYNFYEYTDLGLVPVLNILQESNLQMGWGEKCFNFSASIVDTKPLTLKMVYFIDLPDRTNHTELRIVKDSTQILFMYDNDKKLYHPDFSKSSLDEAKITSFYLGDNNYLFINSYYKTLKELALQNSQPLFDYLESVKNSERCGLK